MEVPPRPGYQLKDNLQYPCTATAIVAIANCITFLHLLRMVWTKEGWVDSLLALDEWWNEDGTYDHLDLDLDGHDDPGV